MLLKNNNTKSLEDVYDFKKISQIVNALEYLKNEALKSGDEDITVIIESAFNMCFCAYYLALRTKSDIYE